MRRGGAASSTLAFILLVTGCGAPAAIPGGGGSSAPASAPDFRAEYRLYSPTAADSAYTMGAQRFADLTSQRTKRRISIKVFPDGKLAPGEQEALQGLKEGRAEMGRHSGSRIWRPGV